MEKDEKSYVPFSQSLSAKPVGPAIGAKAVTYAWTIDSHVAESDYHANSSAAKNIPLSPADLVKSAITFFWTTGTTTGGEESAQCTLIADGHKYQRTVNFNVFAPKVIVTVAPGAPNAFYYKGWPTVQMQHIQGVSIYGIDITATVTVPAGFTGGSWLFAQKVVPHRSYVSQNNVTEQNSMNGKTDVLDTSFPYQAVQGVTPPILPSDAFSSGVTQMAHDGPVESFPPGSISFDVNDSYDMYVFFLPSPLHSCYVQVADVHWAFTISGNIADINGNAAAIKSTPPNANIMKTVAAAPEWAENVVNSKWTP